MQASEERSGQAPGLGPCRRTTEVLDAFCTLGPLTVLTEAARKPVSDEAQAIGCEPGGGLASHTREHQRCHAVNPQHLKAPSVHRGCDPQAVCSWSQMPILHSISRASCARIGVGLAWAAKSPSRGGCAQVQPGKGPGAAAHCGGPDEGPGRHEHSGGCHPPGP